MADKQRLSEQRLLEVTRRVAELVSTHSLEELTVQEDGLRVTVQGVRSAPAPPVGVVLHPHLLPVQSPPPVTGTAPPAPGNGGAGLVPTPPLLGAGGPLLLALESPMVGVYYRSPTPDDPPFVNVGDTIQVGQTVGLIEAMKVYSELPSDISGRVVRLAAENGALVQQGQPLLYVEPV